MRTNYEGWRRLFLFCLGLFAGTAFCMKWMERDLLYQGELFTVIGLEISYPLEKVSAILGGIDEPVRNVLRYHLYFDFAFMCGVYPGIAALCMMGRARIRQRLLKQMLLFLAIAQVIAFACDIRENLYLLNWLSKPGTVCCFGPYHGVVLIKWGLALAGALLGIPFAVRKTAY